MIRVPAEGFAGTAVDVLLEAVFAVDDDGAEGGALSGARPVSIIRRALYGGTLGHDKDNTYKQKHTGHGHITATVASGWQQTGRCAKKPHDR